MEDQFSPLEFAWGPFLRDGADVPILLGGTKGYAPHTFRLSDTNYFTCFWTHHSAFSHFILGLSLREELFRLFTSYFKTGILNSYTGKYFIPQQEK